MRYLTLDQIKKHLNIDNDFTEDDSYLESLETVAIELIQKHIDHSLILLEVDGQLPLSLQQGILLCIGNFYNNRESVAYASTHEIPSNLQWVLDLYQYYDSTSESGGDSDIEKKLSQLEEKIKELVKAIESKADQSTIDTLTTDISTLSNIVSTKLDTTTFTDYQTTVDTKFDNIEKEISKAGKIDDVQVNGQSVVEDKVAKIDLTSYVTSGAISGLNTRISNNEIAINTANRQITDLDNRVFSCENSVRDMGNAVSSKLDQAVYYSNKKEIESKISTNTTDISTLNTAVDNLKTSIPTKTSQLTNDSGYLTEHQSLDGYAKTSDVNTALAAKADATELAKKQDTLVSGTSIKTINGLDLLGEGNITIEGGGSGGSGTVTGVSVNGAAAISPDSSGIVKLTDVGSAATIASQAATIANLQTLIDKYKPHWWAWVTCSHEVNIKINGTTITLPEGRSKIEDFESVMYDSSDMTKFVDGITGFDIHSTGSWPLTKIQLGSWVNGVVRGSNNLSSLDLTKCDTSKCTSMSSMFFNCTNLVDLDVSNFDTRSVTTLNYMFQGCSGLTSIDVSNFDTSKCTSMTGIFQGCSNLASIDVSNFDTSKCTSMMYLFLNCAKLTKLDVSNFDTSHVNTMRSMFGYCVALKSLVGLSGWDTSKVTDMTNTFYQISSMTSLNLSGWDLSSVTNITDMFKNGSKLSNLILGEGFGKIPSGLTLDLSGLNQYGNDNYSAYVLSDESWTSFKTLYDRASNGLPTMTIKFSTAQKTNYADWTNFVDAMTNKGYTITVS